MSIHTIIRKINKEHPDPEVIREAGGILRAGGLVAFPTETVYGLGADALNEEAAKKIYAAKGRPSDNPLIIHITNMKDLERIVTEIPETAKKVAESYWPGPLTMIFEKAEIVPYGTTGGLKTVAVRMPDHPAARAVIDAGGGYIAAPSANTSGRPSPTCAEHVAEDLSGRIEMIVDAGPVDIGVESTILDMTVDPPMILRPGFVTREMLTEVLSRVAVDRTILDPDGHLRPKAPGMRYRHYAPKGELVVVEGERDAVVFAICEKCNAAKEKGERVGVIATDETAEAYRKGCRADSVKSVGSRKDPLSVGHSLYRILREFDDEGMTAMFSGIMSRPFIRCRCAAMTGIFIIGKRNSPLPVWKKLPKGPDRRRKKERFSVFTGGAVYLPARCWKRFCRPLRRQPGKRSGMLLCA